MKPDLNAIQGIRSVAEQVYPFVPDPISVIDLFRRHDFRTEDPRSLREILRRWNPLNEATVTSALAQNTFLMRIIGHVETFIPTPIPIPVEIDVRVVEKPDTLDRAREFGVALSQSDLDLAFLCEVWTDDVKFRLLSSFAGNLKSIAEGPPGGTSTVVVGPGGAAPIVARIGSGLCALGINRSIQEHVSQTFSVQGTVPRDADALSQKSVMLSRVDIGLGILDFYSTHLFNGGGLASGDPSPSEKLSIQLTQIAEIVQFIQDTHRKEHVALLVGDFNIDANVKDMVAYGSLTSSLKNVGLFDVWPFQFSQAAGVQPGQEKGAPGITELGEENPQLAGLCHELTGGVCSEDELPPTTSGNGRIDYVFLEKMASSHAFNVVISAVQRKVFHRNQPGVNFPFLSDHLGLGFNLICSQR